MVLRIAGAGGTGKEMRGRGAPAARMIWFSLAIALGGCGFGLQPIGRGEVESFLGRPLPAEIIDLRAATDRWAEQIVFVRFTAPEAVAAAFARGLSNREPEPFEPSDFRPPENAPDWWPTTLPSGAVRVNGGDEATGRSFETIVAPGPPGLRVVCIFAHGS